MLTAAAEEFDVCAGEEGGVVHVPGVTVCVAGAHLGEVVAVGGVDAAAVFGDGGEEGGVFSSVFADEGHFFKNVSVPGDGGSHDEGAPAVFTFGVAEDGSVAGGQVHVVGLFADDVCPGVAHGVE